MYGKELYLTELISDANLEAYLRLEGNVTDSSPDGRTFSASNITYSSTSGKFGQHAVFNGTSSYIDLTNFNYFSGDFSLSAWIKRGGTGASHQGAIFGKYKGAISGQWLYVYFDASNLLGFSFYADDLFANVALTDTSNWHHIVATYRASDKRMQIFLDGVLVGTRTSTSTLDLGTGSLAIGRLGTGTYFNGNIDDPSVFSRVLTDTEISALYFNSPRYGDWTGSKRLYVPETKVSGSSNLADFPVVIKDAALPSSVYSGMQSDDDIRFTTDSDGEVTIPHETVSINRGSNLSEIWVKIPTLSHSLDTQFYVWYGNSNAPAVTANAVVIGSQKVWADERGSYRLQGVTDSSPNGRTLTNNSSVAFNPAQFGNGADMSSSNSSKSLSRADDFGINGSNPPVSISFSVKMQEEISSSYQGFVTLGDGGSFVLYQIYYEYNSGTRRIVFNRQKAGLSNHTFSHNVTLGTTNYHRIVLTYDGSTVRGYIDGQSVGSLSISGNGSSGISDIFTLGVADSNRYASAIFDEVRVRAGTLSADWIATEYTMMNDPAAFVLSVELPTVITNAASLITSVSAQGNGEVTDDGNGTVTEKGIVYATTPSPDTGDNKVTDGSGLGVIAASMTGLIVDTHYYVRAYAINEAGTAYGSEVEFDTLDAVISGSATNGGAPVEGAIITLIDSGTDEVVDTATTDVNGEYAFLNLDVTKTYHVAAEYADGYDLYNAKSLPFMTPEEV